MLESHSAPRTRSLSSDETTGAAIWNDRGQTDLGGGACRGRSSSLVGMREAGGKNLVTAERDRRRGDGCRGAEMRGVRDGPGDVLRRRVHLARWRALGIAHVVDRMDGDFNGRKSQRKGKNQDAGLPPAPRAEEDGAEHGQKEESVTACGWGPGIADRVNRPQTVRARRRFSGKIPPRRPPDGT